MYARRIRYLLSLVLVTLVAQTARAQDPEQALSALDSLLNVPVSAAAKYAQRRSEAPASITIVTAEEVRRYGYRTLADVLNDLPGFYVSNDHNYTYVGVRGFGRPADFNNRVLVQINGHTLNESFVGAVGIGREFGIDLDAIERIEIVRGPGSSLHGARAMFAVVNLITRDGRAIDGFETTGELGNLGTWRTSIVGGTTLFNELDVQLSASVSSREGQDFYYPEFDQPTSNDGTAVSSDRDQARHLQASVSYAGFTLDGLASARDKTVPTAAFFTNFSDPNNETHDERHFIELKYASREGMPLQFSAQTYANFFGNTFVLPYEGWSLQHEIWTSWIGTEGRLRWDPIAKNRLVVGAEVQRIVDAHNKASAVETGEVFKEGDYPYTVVSVFLQNELQLLEQLALTLGIRHDDYSIGESSTTPRAAVVYHPWPSTTLKALYGEGFRPANLFESRATPPFYFVDNNDLGPEKIRTTELVWEQRLTPSLVMTTALYNNEIRDLIEPVPQGLAQGPTTLVPSFQYQNRGNLAAQGLETELRFMAASGLWATGSYTFQRVRRADTGDKITNSPAHLARLALSKHFWHGLVAAVNLAYESSRIALYGAEVDDFLLTDITISAPWLLDHLSLSAQVKNLLATDYYMPAGPQHRQRVLPQYGRELFLTLRYRF